MKDHAWHWANELCFCNGLRLKALRPLSVKSDIPVYK